MLNEHHCVKQLTLKVENSTVSFQAKVLLEPQMWLIMFVSYYVTSKFLVISSQEKRKLQGVCSSSGNSFVGSSKK